MGAGVRYQYRTGVGAVFPHTSGSCVHSARCGSNLVMEPDGQLYACDHLINAEHRLGRLDEQAARRRGRRLGATAFGQQKSLRREMPGLLGKNGLPGAAARRISTPQATTASAAATTASLATSSRQYAPFSRDLYGLKAWRAAFVGTAHTA